jgi:hypothetical protein
MKIRLRSGNTRRISLAPIVPFFGNPPGFKKPDIQKRGPGGPVKTIYANARGVKQSSTTPVKKLYAKYSNRKPNDPARTAEKSGVHSRRIMSFMKKT